MLYETPITELTYKYKSIEYINYSEVQSNQPRYMNINDYVAFDLETTGLNPEKDKIINIGAIRYRNNMPVDELNILVNPQKDIPEIITNITGITTDMVKDKPTIKEVLPTLLEFIGKDIVLGHNVRFDLGFLNYALEVHGFEHYVTKYVDTLTIARSFRKNNKLENLVKDYLKPDFIQAHLALSDAKYTAEIFKVFKNMYIKPCSCYNLNRKCE